MKTIETKMPFCKSVSRWAGLWLLALGIFVVTRVWMAPRALAQSTYEPYTFTTVAGGDYHSVDGTGSAARFSGISAIAVDSAGNVCVSDGATLRKVTAGGVGTAMAGPGPSDDAGEDG